MALFEIQWRSSTKKDLRKLPAKEVARIVALVETLASEPFPHGTENCPERSTPIAFARATTG